MVIGLVLSVVTSLYFFFFLFVSFFLSTSFFFTFSGRVVCPSRVLIGAPGVMAEGL